MVGARLALGATKSSVRALVQGTGTAMRMNAECFLREFRRSQTLQRVLLQFTDRLMDPDQSDRGLQSISIVVEARLARSLLMTAERMRSAAFHLTHGFIADMLGVRREGVTVAAIALQRRGYHSVSARQHHHPRPARAWKQRCCSCYRHLQLMDSESR